MIDPSGLTPNFGPSGNGCTEGRKQDFAGCCRELNFFQIFFDQAGSSLAEGLQACLRTKKVPVPEIVPINVLKGIVKYWDKACNDKNYKMCIWCGSKPPNTNWPPTCPDICKGKLPMMLTPVWDPNVKDVDTPIGCTPTFPIAPGCDSLRTLPGAPCDSVIVECQNVGPTQILCPLLFHEMLHSLGFEARGHETYVGGKANNDFIYAIQCCMCMMINGENSPLCNFPCSPQGKFVTK